MKRANKVHNLTALLWLKCDNSNNKKSNHNNDNILSLIYLHKCFLI